MVRYISFPINLLKVVGSAKVSPLLPELRFKKFICVETGVDTNMPVSCRRSIAYFG